MLFLRVLLVHYLELFIMVLNKSMCSCALLEAINTRWYGGHMKLESTYSCWMCIHPGLARSMHWSPDKRTPRMMEEYRKMGKGMFVLFG